MHNFVSSKKVHHFLSENRIYVLLLIVFGVMSLLAPHFLTWQNQTTIMKGMSLNMPAAIGFAIVMICGQLDLSIGTNLTLGGMLTIGLQPQLGWPASIGIGVCCGLLVGCINGLLVAKGGVDSFIVTLGMMIVTQGLMFQYSHGGSLFVDNFDLGTWMETPLVPLFPPRVIMTVLIVLGFEIFLLRTGMGRGFYLIGGNRMTAWNAGLPVDRYLISAFVLSGGLASLGGSLFAIGLNSAMPTMGNNSLMEVVAAVIIGGTSMTGGKGSVFKSMIALLTLTMLYNGLECMGAGWEAHKMASGFVLAVVVLYDALVSTSRKRMLGSRPELIKEMETMKNHFETEGTDMNHKDSTIIAITAIGVTGCVAIVAIFTMFFMSQPSHPHYIAVPPDRTQSSTSDGSKTVTLQEQWAKNEKIIARLTSKDGQPLILPPSQKDIPPRPADPQAFPQEDRRHWYDMEYSGWGVQKINQPISPADGPAGKKVVYLKAIDHPYQTAMVRGMNKVAQVYGIEVKYKTANNDINIQNQQVDQVINERPDLVIISPVDAKACVPLFKKLNEVGIPVIAINLIPDPEAHKYLLTWTGPDDWRQMRLLAQEFARRMNYEGGYCIVQHRAGSSPFFSRTWSIISELHTIAPQMKLLAMQTTDLESEKTKDVVSGWITRFGNDLNGIASADDSGAQIGINEAIKNAGREDIIRVAAGNSKVGMDFIKEGRLHAITYQSPEADGAIPMKLAADWFYGKPIPVIRYLPIAIITKENVDDYMPAQW